MVLGYHYRKTGEENELIPQTECNVKNQPNEAFNISFMDEDFASLQICHINTKLSIPNKIIPHG